MQKKQITSAMVRKEYQQLVSAYSRTIPDAALRLRFTLSADVYFRRCAICVWSRGGAASETEVEAYNAICSKGSTPPSALYFEVVTLVSSRPEFEVPVFYEQLLDCDLAYGSTTANGFRILCESLLLLFAAVDDQVTEAESEYVAQCVQLLKEYVPGQPAPVIPRPATPTPEAPAEAKKEEAPKEEEKPEETVEELLAQLDELTGLEQVKKDVRSMINLIKVRRLRQENGLPVPPLSLHLVFLGNPGTGKTTVARLLAKLYHAIGVLPKGQLVEVDRSGLVAGYIGQTAQKTQEVCAKAMGGVLFIDEAYSLTNQKGENDFGKEAIEVILKNMEDHRDELVVIAAGYEDLMEEFVHSNPGLESRFNRYFYFEDYNGEQLEQIFLGQCKKNGYTPDEETKQYLPGFFSDLFENRDENFGNARTVRNIFEALVVIQSDRVSQLENPSVEDLMQFTLADFRAAAEVEEEEEQSTPAQDAPVPTLTLTPDLPAEAPKPEE